MKTRYWFDDPYYTRPAQEQLDELKQQAERWKQQQPGSGSSAGDNMTIATITLQRSGLCPVRFTGELIARSPLRIDADTCAAGRYVTIEVYRTARSSTVVHLHYATDHHGEQDNHLVALTGDVPRYLETIDPGEWCRGPPAARAALRSQYQAAIASLLPNLHRMTFAIRSSRFTTAARSTHDLAAVSLPDLHSYAGLDNPCPLPVH